MRCPLPQRNISGSACAVYVKSCVYATERGDARAMANYAIASATIDSIFPKSGMTA